MITTTELIQTLRTDGVKLSSSDGKLKIDAPAGVLSAENKELLKAHKSKILGNLFQERINAFIQRGIFFELHADKFKLTGNVQLATADDINFLTVNAPQVLCHLRQIQLVKDVFDHDSKLLDVFKFEVIEREAILTAGFREITVGIHEAAVIYVTGNWWREFYEAK